VTRRALTLAVAGFLVVLLSAVAALLRSPSSRSRSVTWRRSAVVKLEISIGSTGTGVAPPAGAVNARISPATAWACSIVSAPVEAGSIDASSDRSSDTSILNWVA